MNAAAEYFLFQFEAKGIQEYIFESGKLVEMVGASNIIETLLEGVFLKTAAELDGVIGLGKTNDEVRRNERIIRRASGALLIVMRTHEEATVFRNIWSLVLAETAPALRYSHVIGTGNSFSKAYDDARKKISAAHNRLLADHVIANPVILRAPRTGRAAVPGSQSTNVKKDILDAASKKKREFGWESNTDMLSMKFLSESDSEKYVFPRILRADDIENISTENVEVNEKIFPGLDENRYLAVVVIDGNAGGSVFSQVVAKNNELKYIKEYSDCLTKVTREAAKAALKEVIFPDYPETEGERVVLPFRGLIFGGDDLGLLIGANHALQFVEKYIFHLENMSTKRFKKLNGKFRPELMTACAGVAFVKSTQPFYMAYELADSLCRYAKTEARRSVDNQGPIPSAIAFHRVTSSFISDYDVAIKDELTVRENIAGGMQSKPIDVGGSNQVDSGGVTEMQLTLGAYGLGRIKSDLPEWEYFKSIVSLFESESFSGGPLRNFLTLLHSDSLEAKMAFKRWSKNLKSRDPLKVQVFDEATRSLYANEYDADSLPFTKGTQEKMPRTFLGDLMNICAAQGAVHGR